MRLRRRDVHTAGDLRYEPIGSSHSSTYGFKLSQRDVPNDVIAGKILAVSMRERFDEFITVEACAPDYKSRATYFLFWLRSILATVPLLTSRYMLSIEDIHFGLLTITTTSYRANRYWLGSSGSEVVAKGVSSPEASMCQQRRE